VRKSVRYVLVPVPNEYVLDVMRWVLVRTPDGEGESSGRDNARVEALLSELDDLERSLLVLVAKSVWKDDSLTMRDAGEELKQPSQVVSEAIRAINRKAMWGRDVITLRPETTVGVLGRAGRASVLTMWPDTARLVRAATRSPSVPDS
jgi:hypothetical protein